MTDTTVRKTITVQAPPEKAFEAFTGGIGRWWPLDTYKIGAAPAVDASIEPHEGGRWFERGDDGSECDWGRVLAWEPPGRVVLAWQISADWRFDPGVETELEIRFTPEGDGATLVELEHRGLESYGERAEQMAGILGSPQGWSGLLERYSGTVSA